jgi:hypothetical protein
MSDPIFEAYVRLQEQRLDEGRIDWLKSNMKDISFAHDPSGPAKTPPN